MLKLIQRTSVASPSASALEPGDGEERAGARIEDRDLVSAARRGDPAAVEALIQRMRVIARILTLLNQRLGSPLQQHDLADAAQETAVRAWAKLAQFDGSSTLETWFFGFARRELHTALRRSRKHAGAQLSESQRAAQSESGLVAEQVRAALATLDPHEARMIVLHHFEELTLEQASERAGLSLSTAKRRYYRGIARLSQLLRRQEEGRDR